MSEYFDYSTGRLVPGTTARAVAVNTIFDALDTGLDKLPDPDHIKRGVLNYAVATGTSNAIVVALEYAPTAYEDGMEVVFKATGTNTSTVTINVDSLGAKSIRRQDGSALVAGDITIAKIHTIRYNSTSGYFEIQGSPVGTGGAGTMSNQNASAVDITGGTIKGITAETDAGSVATIDGTQTLTNKTLTSPVLNTGLSGTAFLDEDTMVSNAADKAASQQSIKAYVDSGTVTMTNKRLTSPKINENVELLATATELNAVCDGASSGSSAAGGDFTGTVSWNKIGKMVVVAWGAMTHASSSGPTSSAGVIPAGFRPAADHYGSVPFAGGGNSWILVDTTGVFVIYYRDSSGNASNQTGVVASSTCYLIA